MLITRSLLTVKGISHRPFVFPSVFHRCPRSTSKLAIPPPVHTVFVRYYARRTARSTRVEEDVMQQQQRQPTGLQERVSDSTTTLQQEKDRIEEQDSEKSTEHFITPDVRRFISKVYGTLMAGLGMAAVGIALSFAVPALALPGMIGSLIGVIAIVFMDKRRVVTRQNIFLAVGTLTGMAIGPLIASSAPGVVLAAALGTSAIFGGFTLAALKAKHRSMLMLGGVLGGGLLVVFSCGLAGLLLPMFGVTNPAILGALYNINLYLGLGVFSLYVAYDTQRMVDSYTQGDDDHVSPALNLFLDIINIFIRLLQIFGRK